MTSTGMWKREGHDGCLAQIADLRAENEALKGEVERWKASHDFERAHRATEEKNVATLAIERANLLAALAALRGEARAVPILDPLLPILKAWKVASGGAGLVVPPMRCDGEHVDKSTPAQHMRQALLDLGLPPLEPKPWYQATRHTFASQWAMAGNSLRELQKLLGHVSITDTERYAHLAPGFWSEGVYGALQVDLAAGPGQVLELGPARKKPRA